MAATPVRLVLASGNAGKLRELSALLAPRGFDLVTQSSLGVSSTEETGDTFVDNALLKARHAAARTGCAAIADDSGIEVDALGGRPGVRSARYAGENATDEQNNALLLRELAGVALPSRTARYRCVIALVRSAGDPYPLVADGAWEGRILETPRGTGGFGYDPLFLPVGSSLTAAELAPAAKNAVSHRGLALRALLAKLDAGALRG
jgi:XTP/dITP diphosphohydrolase